MEPSSGSGTGTGSGPGAGRSRGRARIRVDPQLTPVPISQPVQPGAQQVPPPPVASATPRIPQPVATPVIQPVVPPVAIAAVSHMPVPPPTRAHSQERIQPAEPGRGRGVASADAASQSVQQVGATTSASHSSGSPQSGGSPTESPPLQHSPSGPAAGRAALRGTSHPLPGAPVGVVDQTERAALYEQAGQPPRRDFSVSSVILTRPATCLDPKGKDGVPIKILCNYFEILNKPDFILYQYHVDFMPPIDNKKQRIQLFNQHQNVFSENRAFDGGQLFTLTRLEREVTEFYSTRDTDQAQITIKFTRICEIAPSSPQFVQLFNIVFRRCLKLYGMKCIDRNYFDTQRKIQVPNYPVEIIDGLATSIATYSKKLMLCAELTHKFLHQQTVYERMSELYRNSRDDADFREKVAVEFVGKIVMTKYNDRTYKVDDISWDENPLKTFPRNTGGEINYRDYYRNNYSIDVGDLEQPLLVSLPKERDKRRGQLTPYKLIPHLCILTGMTDKMREDFRFKKAVESITKVGPSQRVKRLTDFVNSFNVKPSVKEELDRWKMEFSRTPATIPGRMLQAECLAFGGSVTRQLTEKAEWGQDMKSVRLLRPMPLTNWVIVFPQHKSNTAREFVHTYGRTIGSMGIQAEEPIELSIPSEDGGVIVNNIKQVMGKYPGIQMVVVLLTSKRKDRYDAVKRICCLDLPVPSQVVTTAIIEDPKKSRAVITKVAIQMNCKLGGEIWTTNIPLKNVMICGIDTYHDSERKKASVCAFIATYNQEKTRFFSRATIQETHQELSNNLTITVKSACEFYKKQNGAYPDKIIVYRDGVGDGQLKAVVDYEIPQIQKAFALLDASYDPPLTFIVVKKRGNARFFADRNGGQIDNPPCGTVIDSVVTRDEWFDFYLISQVVTQGTVNPTHYNVIYDSYGLKPDHLQKLSYKLTHMYYNWPGTIRVPALCQYAHKLAFLVGQSLHREHDQSLCDKLFYL